MLNRLGGLSITDGNGFPPIRPGSMHVFYAPLVYGNTTNTLLFTLPRDFVIVQWVLNISTAFNDSGTDVIDISDGVTAQKFAAALTASATGQQVTGFVVGQLFTPMAADTPVYGKYTGQNADATAGAAVIACIGIQK